MPLLQLLRFDPASQPAAPRLKIQNQRLCGTRVSGGETMKDQCGNSLLLCRYASQGKVRMQCKQNQIVNIAKGLQGQAVCSIRCNQPPTLQLPTLQLGDSIYQHGKISSLCKECGGAGVRQHGWIRRQCKECEGYLGGPPGVSLNLPEN